MFEHSDIKEKKSINWFWLKVVLGVVVVIAAIQFYRVNRPEPMTAPIETSVAAQYSEGEIVNEYMTVEPGEFRFFKINLNRRATLSGNFKIAAKSPWIDCLILDEANFEKWKASGEFTSLVKTNPVPVGRIHRELAAGVYFLVFDNRSSKEKPAALEASFALK